MIKKSIIRFMIEILFISRISCLNEWKLIKPKEVERIYEWNKLCCSMNKWRRDERSEANLHKYILCLPSLDGISYVIPLRWLSVNGCERGRECEIESPKKASQTISEKFNLQSDDDVEKQIYWTLTTHGMDRRRDEIIFSWCRLLLFLLKSAPFLFSVE